MVTESILNKKLSLPKLSRNTLMAIVILLFVVGLFYWFQYRPSKIRSSCVEEASQEAKELLTTKAKLPGGEEYEEASVRNLFLEDDYDFYYLNCLNSKGLSE